VKSGASRQWVDWRLWSYVIAQQRLGSMKKPGARSPGRGGIQRLSDAGRIPEPVFWDTSPSE
jgi:hypothetical protein